MAWTLRAAKRLADGIGAFDQEQEAIRELLGVPRLKRLGDRDETPPHFALIGLRHLASWIRHLRKFGAVIDERTTAIARLRCPAREVGHDGMQLRARVALIFGK